MSFSTDFLNVCQQLLPRGIAWTRAPSATLTILLGCIADECARFKTDAVGILPECTVKTCTQMINEWETAFGIPHSSDAIAVRRSRVNAKQNAVGGQSVKYFYRVLASYGYNVYPSTTDPHIRIQVGTYRFLRAGYLYGRRSGSCARRRRVDLLDGDHRHERDDEPGIAGLAEYDKTGACRAGICRFIIFFISNRSTGRNK